MAGYHHVMNLGRVWIVIITSPVNLDDGEI